MLDIFFFKPDIQPIPTKNANKRLPRPIFVGTDEAVPFGRLVAGRFAGYRGRNPALRTRCTS